MNQALTLPGIGDLVDGRFRIDRKLGEGGTSTVYEVSHVITDKKFAIKWLLPELALEDAAVDRFIHEARVGGKFAHPHAVQVYDICKASDSFYMLMELLQGESVQTRLEREGRLSVHEACSIVLTCADVLCSAHRVGIIHRDLKPANIFLSKEGDTPEVTKLLDFGISTFNSDLQSLSLTATPTGSVIGTPLYMSPEQMLGEQVDRRADIYALGAVLYELVSGQPPFQADCYGELVVKVTVEASPTPLEQVADVDRQFAAVVARAMARRPEHRFSTVEELIFALRPFAALPDTSTVRTIAAPPSPPRAERPDRPDRTEPTGGQPTVLALEAPRRAPRSFGLPGFWSGALGLGVAGLAIAGAHWLEHSNDAASAAPAMHTVQIDTHQPLALAPDGTLLPTRTDERWNRPPAPEPVEEMLTGRAAPEALPPISPAPSRAVKRARRGSGASSLLHKSHGESGRAEQPEAADHSTTAQPEKVVRDEKSAAPSEPKLTSPQAAETPAPSSVRSAPGDRVQLHRADFNGGPGSANTPPPKASVSRGDF